MLQIEKSTSKEQDDKILILLVQLIICLILERDNHDHLKEGQSAKGSEEGQIY